MKASENGRKTKFMRRPKCGRKAINVLICDIATCVKLMRDPFSG